MDNHWEPRSFLSKMNTNPLIIKHNCEFIDLCFLVSYTWARLVNMCIFAIFRDSLREICGYRKSCGPMSCYHSEVLVCDTLSISHATVCSMKEKLLPWLKIINVIRGWDYTRSNSDREIQLYVCFYFSRKTSTLS